MNNKQKNKHKTIIQRGVIAVTFLIMIIVAFNFSASSASKSPTKVISIEVLEQNYYEVEAGTQLEEIGLPEHLDVLVEIENNDIPEGASDAAFSSFSEEKYIQESVKWEGEYDPYVDGEYILEAVFLNSNVIYHGEMPKILVSVVDDSSILLEETSDEEIMEDEMTLGNFAGTPPKLGYQMYGYGKWQASVEEGKDIQYELTFPQDDETPAKVVISSNFSEGLVYVPDTAVFVDADIQYHEHIEANSNGSTTVFWTIDELPQGQYKMYYEAQVIKVYQSTFSTIPIQTVENTVEISYNDGDFQAVGKLINPVPHKNYGEDTWAIRPLTENGEYDHPSSEDGMRQTYVITYRNASGKFHPVIISDTMKVVSGDATFKYVPNSAIDNLGVPVEPISIVDNPDGGQTLVWDLGVVTNNTNKMIVYDTVISGFGEFENSATIEEGDNIINLPPLERKIVEKQYGDNTKPGDEKEVNTEIPYKIEFDNVHRDPIEVVIEDTMSKGLEYQEGSATLNGAHVSEESIISNEDGSTTVRWKFYPVEMGSYVLNYSAVVTDEALDVGVVTNKASISYERGDMFDLGTLPNPVVPDDDESRDLPNIDVYPKVDPIDPSDPISSETSSNESSKDSVSSNVTSDSSSGTVGDGSNSNGSMDSSDGTSSLISGNNSNNTVNSNNNLSNTNGGGSLNSGENSKDTFSSPKDVTYTPGKNPNTGDSSNLAIWMKIFAGALVGGLALSGVAVWVHKRGKKNS